MADEIDYQIIGDDMQAVEIELDGGEGVRAEAGAMLYMDQGIEMQTSTGGGLFKGFKRMVTGESFFITTFLNRAKDRKKLAFAAPYPGKILALDLSKFGGKIICQKDSFLCAARGIEIEVAFTKKLGAGLFGGEGFILQRLEGDGLAFIHAGGSILERELASGEVLAVDTGCLAAFSASVDYDIQFLGGFKNALLGGEGIFLARLEGPGRVYLAEPAAVQAGRQDHPGQPAAVCSGRGIAEGVKGEGARASLLILQDARAKTIASQRSGSSLNISSLGFLGFFQRYVLCFLLLQPLPPGLDDLLQVSLLNVSDQPLQYLILGLTVAGQELQAAYDRLIDVNCCAHVVAVHYYYRLNLFIHLAG